MSQWNWGDVPSWLTAIFTLGGLVLVWFQLRGLTGQAKLQHYSEYTKRYQEIAARFPEDVNSPDFVLIGREDYASLMRAMHSYFDLCFAEWDLNQKRLIDQRFWETWKEGIQTAMSKAAFKQAWAIIKKDSVFGAPFEGFLDERQLFGIER